jgi:hypothetical protein
VAMGSRFFGTAATMSAIRTRTPPYHTAELGGQTTVMDVVWAPAGREMVLPLADAEGEASVRTASMTEAGRLDEAGNETPIPGLRVVEQRASLTDAAGAEMMRTVQLMIAYNDPAAPAGRDNSSQVLVARFCGRGEAAAASPLHYHVQAATGSWWQATDVFVTESAAGRAYVIGRTPTAQMGAKSQTGAD